MSIISLVLFVLGTIVASFVGVVVGRLNTGQSFVRGRSRCDACGAPLSTLALIPIISYIGSGGRAQCCGARISPLAPLSELLLGSLFVLSYLNLGLTVSLLLVLISLSTLLALVLYDLAHQILPPAPLTIFVASSALTALSLTTSYSALASTFVTALLVGGSLALIHFASRGRAMGLADAPLAFGLSLLVGSVAVTGFVFSFWIGAVIGIVLLLMRPRGSRMGVEVPFAPFLAAGFLLAYFTQWNLFDIIQGLSSH